MRISFNLASRLAFMAGAALLAAGCSGGNNATTENNLSATDANMMMEQSGNDQSAMESAANVTEPTPAEANESSQDNSVLGDTSGGDTGGNTVDSNVSGM